MKNNKLTTREWMLLSGYVDGQLNKAQKKRAEKLISANPQAREIVTRMEATRNLLAKLPARKAPRDFTLSSLPERIIRIPSLFSVVRFSAVAASILFLAVVLTNLTDIFTPTRTLQGGAEVAQDMMAMESAVEEMEDTPDIIYWGGGPPPGTAFGKGGGQPGGIGGGGGAAEQGVPDRILSTPEASILSEEAPAPAESPQTAPETQSDQEENEKIQGKATDQEIPQELILGIPPVEQRGLIKDSEKISPIQEAQKEIGIPIKYGYFLGGLILILGVLAWILRKN